VPPRPAREVESLASAWQEIDVLHQPGRRAESAGRAPRRETARPAPEREAPFQIEDPFHSGPSEKSGGRAAADSVLAVDEKRSPVARQRGRPARDQINGEENGVGDVTEALVLLRSPDVKDADRALPDQALGLCRIDGSEVGTGRRRHHLRK